MSEIILSVHAISQLLDRGIDTHEAKKIAKQGDIIKTGYGGIIIGRAICSNGRLLEVVSVKKDNKIIIITAYYGD